MLGRHWITELQLQPPTLFSSINDLAIPPLRLNLLIILILLYWQHLNLGGKISNVPLVGDWWGWEINHPFGYINSFDFLTWMGVLPACLYVWTTYIPSALGGQKRSQYLLNLGLQKVVNTVWVLGIEPGFSGRVANAPNHGANSADSSYCSNL